MEQIYSFKTATGLCMKFLKIGQWYIEIFEVVHNQVTTARRRLLAVKCKRHV